MIHDEKKIEKLIGKTIQFWRKKVYGCECYSPIQEFKIGKNYKIIFGENDLPF